MVLLFVSELRDYMTPGINEELFVDTSRGSKLKINLDIIVPMISCDRKHEGCFFCVVAFAYYFFVFLIPLFYTVLSLDAMDTTGEQHLQIEHNIFKRRLDLSGKPIEDPKKTDIMETKSTAKTDKV